jgi:hypothetical protein|tara:strand:- start:774 stop:1145 length:372 start_codon:yes stop_codon:yes gene_type:complete
MKNLFLVMSILLSTTIYGQEFNTDVKKSTKEFELMYDDYYKVTMSEIDGTITQEGFYSVGEDGKLDREGKWVLYSDGEILSVGQFSNDQLVWIKSGGEKFTRQQIIDERKRLRSTSVALNTIK